MDVPRVLIGADDLHFVETQCQACSHALNRAGYTAAATGMNTALLSAVSRQHMMPLTDGWQVAADSSVRWGIAALNPAAAQLLSAFDRGAWPEPVFHAMQERWPVEHSRAAVAKMIDAGLLVPAEVGPSVKAESPHTLIAWLHMTDACNLSCSYCYVRRSGEHMPADTGRQAVDAILGSATRHNLSGVKLKYAGGEPTLRFDHMVALHRYALRRARDAGLEMEAIMLTNGVSLSDAMLRTLQAEGIKLAISLDGLDETHDTQRARENGEGSAIAVRSAIDRAIALGVRPDVNVTVTARNLVGLPETVAWLLERDIYFCLNLYRVGETSAGDADLMPSTRELVKAIRDALAVIEADLPDRCLVGSLLDRVQMLIPHHYACAVGHNHLAVDQKGGVHQCQMKMDRPTTTVWAEDPLDDLQRASDLLFSPSVDEKPECSGCAWRYWCAGGCPLEARRTTGRYTGRSPYCAAYRALIPDLLRLEGLRLLKWRLPMENLLA